MGKRCNPRKMYLVSLIMLSIPPTRCYALKAFLWRWAGVQVGKNVEITSSARVYGELSLEIGDNVYIGHEAMLFGGRGCSIVLEKFSKIGSRVTIPTGFHEITPEGDCIEGKGTSSSVRISQGSVISTGSIVLPGVTIGKMSHAAAGSVITKDVPDYVRVAGVPAKVVRQFK